VTANLKLKPGSKCDLDEIPRGGPGDTAASDWHYSLDWFPLEPERQLWFLNEEKVTAGPGDYGCDPDDIYKWPDRETSKVINDTGRVETKIPYLGQVAKRLIGQGGVFKILMPQGFNEDIVEAINKYARGRVYPWELPGYGPADFMYMNGLDREDVKEHWGCCDKPPESCGSGPCENDCDCGSCGEGPHEDGDCVCKGGSCIIKGSAEDCVAPCNCGYCSKANCGPVFKDGSDVRGWGSVSEGQFYYPYVGAIDIFRQYFMNAVVPSELSTLGTETSASTD